MTGVLVYRCRYCGGEETRIVYGCGNTLPEIERWFREYGHSTQPKQFHACTPFATLASEVRLGTLRLIGWRAWKAS